MNIIEKIKEIFSNKENFAQFKLADGTIVMAESLEPGMVLEVIFEDGTTELAKEGEYMLEDGRVVYVDAEGKIVEVKDAEEDAAEPAGTIDDAPAAEEMAEEVPMYVEVAAFESKIAELENAIIMLSEKLAEMEGMKAENDVLVEEMSAIKAENEELKSIPEPAKEAVEARFKRISDIIETNKETTDKSGDKFGDFIKNFKK